MTIIVPFQDEATYNGLSPIGQPLKNLNGFSKQKRPSGRRPIPPSSWTPVCHPLVDPVTAEVDAWFLDNWSFPNEKARKKFVAAGFSKVTCLYFPLAKDDRIAFACRLLAILFLIDDLLEYMSLEEGKAYNDKLMPLARGEAQPDRTIPVEAMFYDLWASMREKDQHLADQVLEPTFVFMRAQTEGIRTEITELGQYLQYRERDVGKALLSALMRFAMDLHLSDEELAEMKEVEQNCAKHISIVNDIYSWEKELKQSQVALEEGSILCSGVKVLADSTGLSIEAAKTCLWSLVREWELKHEILSSEPFVSSQCSKAQKLYLQGLEYQMSGNELWSRTTPRYLVVD
ncbi:aristolochene synthase [Colletotrichum higginsianum IMI 349063]|uniref:Terpene synthase n=2 Tax=Colletotrichum higginsianum TaxID=80884 RepID=A0A1B7YFP7_COLHI|nr:aristolochene synthase [Colletotrichum higginsianum IMI 349063]OBR10835.1 aristolochene synthase [Colletotrichum higginsianum IMI 349063]TID06363.1 Aristolochene synthase [Colletotrichum higginsianum]